MGKSPGKWDVFFLVGLLAGTLSSDPSSSEPGKEQVPGTISCSCSLSVVRMRQWKVTSFWLWMLLNFQCPVFCSHYIMCDHKQRICLQNMPGLIHPKKVCHPSELLLWQPTPHHCCHYSKCYWNSSCRIFFKSG